MYFFLWQKNYEFPSYCQMMNLVSKTNKKDAVELLYSFP